MASDADRLIQGVPIESFIQRYLPLKKKGNNYWANCPFHSEKSPSFSVSPEKGIFKCFGCGKGGNVITFVQEYEKVEFKEALKILSEYSGIPLEGIQSPASNKAAEKAKQWKDVLIHINSQVKEIFARHLTEDDASQYIAGRNIRPETALHFQLGYSPPVYQFLESQLLSKYEGDKKQQAQQALLELGLLAKSGGGEIYNRFRGRLMFPIIGKKGETIAFGGRVIKQSDAGKYVNSPESPLFHKKLTLYNLYPALEEIRKAGQVILVEGYLDVLGLYQAGIKNTVAPLGTAFSPEQAKLIKRYTDSLIIFFDGDSAGIEAAYRSLLAARPNKLNVRVVVLSGAHRSLDPFDISQKLDPMDIMTLLDGARSEVSFVLWYFFTHKYNIKEMDQKREAMNGFFEYVTGLDQEWEKDEYLKEASEKLRMAHEIIRQDLKKFTLGQPSFSHERRRSPQEDLKPAQKTVRIEKEILSLLLRYPACWNDKALLDEIQWSSKEPYLLYVFFRDRLRSGEFWKWEELNQVISILPDKSMVDLLSEILISMEPVFEDFEQGANESEINSQYDREIQKLIMLQKKERLLNKIETKKAELNEAENARPEEAETLTEELAVLLGEKKKVEEFLAARR